MLQRFADGLSTREVAEALLISTNTVRTHVENILSKLGVHSRLEAVLLGARAGIVSFSPEPGKPSDEAPATGMALPD